MRLLTIQLIGMVFLAQLVACGGSGSDGGTSGTTPANQAPTANAGSDQAVNEQTTVTLLGSGADSDGSVVNYNWIQTEVVPKNRTVL